MSCLFKRLYPELVQYMFYKNQTEAIKFHCRNADKIHPIVLPPDKLGTEIKTPEQIEGILNLPFPVCSIETAERETTYEFQDNYLISIPFIVVEEIMPGTYEFLTAFSIYPKNYPSDAPTTLRVMLINKSDSGPYPMLYGMVKYKLDQLQSSQIKIGHIDSETIKFREFKNQIAYRRIQNTIYCTTKSKFKDHVNNPLFKKIDWSCRWDVRGHWRRYNGLGKDREGNRCVNGLTWVIPHEKGPEEAPLVTKVRKFREALS